MLTTFVQGKSLDRHIKNGDFFANKDGMKKAMHLLLTKMVKASVLYRDIHPYNIVFDQNNKAWAIIDTHYPLMFDSPTIALKYMKRSNPWSKYYGAKIREKN